MEWTAGLVAPMRVRQFILIGLLVTAAGAAPLKFSSGENRTHLIELYSAEGCSSCPPAEQWLGELRAHPGLWHDFVPVAFHVVYWDHLGWRDRFANKEYTARQYAYSSLWTRDTVYTPGFVLDGLEWRRTSGQHPPHVSPEKTGTLSVEYAADGGCQVKFNRPGDFEVHAALLGGGISSPVRAGENQGRTLLHEFVVLALQSTGLVNGVAEIHLPGLAREGVARFSLAVWVTHRGELRPLQATGGWLN